VALRGLIGKTEYRKALRGSPSEIKRQHAELMLMWGREIQAAQDTLGGRLATVSAHDVEAICGDYYRERARELERLTGAPDPIAWSVFADQLIDLGNRDDYGHVTFEPRKADLAEADDLLRSHGIAADAGSVFALAERLWETKIRIAKLMERRGEGDWGHDPVAAKFCSATGRMAGFRRSDGRSQRGVMMAFPKVSDKKICR
jgi:hypothetical protein